jgi:hypothetical protein
VRHVSALQLPDEVQLDAVGVCCEQASACAQQNRDEVDLQLVELAGPQQRLSSTGAVHHDGSVTCRGPACLYRR